MLNAPYFLSQLAAVHWSALLEIAIFSVIFYSFLRWLAQDKQKNLIGWFYGYVCIYSLAWQLNLMTIHLFLVLGAPFMLFIFCMLHQKTLQKNFISLNALQSPTQITHNHWLEELMQACLHGINTKKEIFVFIERADSLDLFLSASYFIKAPIQQPLLQLLMNNADDQITLWVTHNGMLQALNPHYLTSEDTYWMAKEIQQLPTWQQKALLITQSSTTIAFSISPLSRQCTVIINDKITSQLQPSQALQLMQQYCLLTRSRGESHDPLFKTSFNQKQVTH